MNIAETCIKKPTVTVSLAVAMLVAGVIGYEGLEALVDLCESGVSLFRMGRLCAWACLLGAILGAALMIGPCWLGKWETVSAAKVLLYMLLWAIPGPAAALTLRK